MDLFNTPQGEQEEEKEGFNSFPQESQMIQENEKTMYDSQISDPLLVNHNRAEQTLQFLKSDPQLSEKNIHNWHENIVHMTKTITELTKSRTKCSDLDALCKLDEEIRVTFDLILQKDYPQLAELLFQQRLKKQPEQEKIAVALCSKFEYGEQLYDKEGRQTEFKNYQLNSFQNIKCRDIIRKTITSFLNQQGGTIFIGIRDYDMTVQGIDLSKKDMDTLKLNITEIRRAIEPDCNNLVDVDFIPLIQWGEFAKGKWVVRIKVQQGETNSIYAYKSSEEDNYAFSSAFREDGSTQRYGLSKFLLQSKEVAVHGRHKAEKIQYAQPHKESFRCEVTSVQNLYAKVKDGFKKNNNMEQYREQGDFKEGQKKIESGNQDYQKKQDFQANNNQPNNIGYVKKSNVGSYNNNNNFNKNNPNSNYNNNNGNYQYLPVQKQSLDLSSELQRKEKENQKLLKDIKDIKSSFENERKELIEKATKYEKKYQTKKDKIQKLKTKNEELSDRLNNKSTEADINTNKLIESQQDFRQLLFQFQAYKEQILFSNQTNQVNQTFQVLGQVQQQQQDVFLSQYGQEFQRKDGTVLPITLAAQPQPQINNQNINLESQKEKDFLTALPAKIQVNPSPHQDLFQDKKFANEKLLQAPEKPISPKELQEELLYNDNAPSNQSKQKPSKSDNIVQNYQNEPKQSQRGEINENNNKNIQNNPYPYEYKETDRGYNNNKNNQPKQDNEFSMQIEKPVKILENINEVNCSDARDSSFNVNENIQKEKKETPQQLTETPGEQQTGNRNNKREKQKFQDQSQDNKNYEKKTENNHEFKKNYGQDNQQYVSKDNIRQFQGQQDQWQKKYENKEQKDQKQYYQKGQNQYGQKQGEQHVIKEQKEQQQNSQKGKNQNDWKYVKEQKKNNSKEVYIEQKQPESKNKYDFFSNEEESKQNNQLIQENHTPELAKVPGNNEEINDETLNQYQYWIIIVAFFEHEAGSQYKELIKQYPEQKNNIKYDGSRKLVSFFFSSKKDLQSTFSYCLESQIPYFKIIVKGIKFSKKNDNSNTDDKTVIYFNTTKEQLKDPQQGLTQPIVYLNIIKAEENIKEQVKRLFKCEKIISPKPKDKSKMIVSTKQEFIDAIDDKQYNLIRKDNTKNEVGFIVDSNIQFKEITNQKGLINEINELLSDKIVFGKFEFLFNPDDLQIVFENSTEALIAYINLKDNLCNEWFKHGSRKVDLTSVCPIPLS